MGNPVWFIFWLLVFWIISLAVAFFCAFFYIVIYTLVVCIPGLSGISDVLLQGLQFPHYCAKAMVDCKPPF
ncbi:uncharacterized protein LOC115761258 [Drosophila novamexicana]|uniref:Uncharacterized protein n=1 Tax=Drosophila virilis TaxID=7244 RepID=B4M6K4_DROVI|nr:uncharacterized protein LOC6632438 [Drosophila virilis]XP_030558831.1 uncharacterized protein LOC115761258 [Drosophila novamexicana]EDW59280.1 uncharacterized protein Dvir_GJ10369 [Drosophila virilis]